MKRDLVSLSYRLARRTALAAIGLPLLIVSLPAYGQGSSTSGPKPTTASAPRVVSESTIAELVQKAMSQRNIPGASVAVVRDGKTILTRGYGLANVETKTPATEQTAYQLASVTKQFTAAGILLLIEEGKVKLDEPFVTYLPNLPAAWKERWKEVKVRHLLNHTSGIESYTSLPDFGKTMRKDYTHQELIGLIADKPLRWKPGEKWDYNNTGYYLLGMVIEKVSGKSYNDFLTERIFQPLGMNDTRVNDLQEVIPNRATGYGMGLKGLRNGEYTSPTQPYAAGALISTVADMAKWAEAVDAGKVLKAESWKEAWTPTKLADGKTEGYGFGWSLGTANGHPMISHGGGIPGFSTDILRLPDDKLTVIVLANQEGANSGSLSRQIAALYVPDSAEPAAKPIADPDPMLTKRLRAIVENAAKGKAKESDFTPEMWKVLYPDRLQQGKAALSQLGTLKSFELLARQEAEGLLRLGYRAIFGTTSVRVSFGLTKEGKIAGMGLRPE